ncbi:Ig-like domain-containing protein [Actinoplanes sp. HUAS TT8]|uniref:Ig-like domain-containing protein n=1 Tax=Actinoplanes sp. HUAS TT8 TaxID=3447453 RepID=UPI003F52666C
MQLKSRTAKGALVAVAATALVLPFGAAAQAAPPAGSFGTLTATPATGADITVPKVRTSAGCGTTGADSYWGYLFGPGKFTGGVQVVTPKDTNFSATAPFDIQVDNSFKDVATDQGTTIVAGEYDLVITCVDSFEQHEYGTFTTAFYFTSPTAYTTTDPNSSSPSTTTISVDPTGPVTAGDEVTLKAAVTPAAAAGKVQFKDGSENLGSEVTVANGVAELKTTALTAGTHTLTAVFTPTTAGVSGSTSSAATLVVNRAAAQATSVGLAVNPQPTVEQFSPVALTATVSPSEAAGKVQFTDGGQNLGAPVTVSGGTAVLNTSSLSEGDHGFTAKFVPADAAVYTASESASVPLTVTAFKGGSASQTISTTVESGALTISVANNAPVVLPAPALTSDASKLTTAGSINPLTVTDTRAGNFGWNVSGQVSDFSDGASHAINGANLGWSPKLVDKSASQTITPGSKVDPANAIAPQATAPNGLGLASARTLALAGAGAGVGTAHVTADVSLQVPTTTVAGTYTATLTITAI